MQYLSAAQMREADRRAIHELGIPGAVLMHNAGRAIFLEIAHGPVGIVCGKGNNGGDGFVVAYLALLAGFDVRVVLLADTDEVRGDAATFLRVFLNLGGHVTAATDAESAARCVHTLESCATLVDAMLGTGAAGAVREPYGSAIHAWPARHTIAVDIPSGLDADSGVPGNPCIRADVTVTMQFPKKGFANPLAQPYLGRLVVADIGIPRLCADDDAWGKR
jgi:NAD(P)H-hydrate epimerase